MVYGKGVHSQGLCIQIPRLNVGGRGSGGPIEGSGVHNQKARTEGIYAWFAALSQRLRRVRVCCGDWTRIMGPSVIYGNGITGVFLDPPYDDSTRAKDLYAEDSGTVSADVRRWAIEHGDDPRLRICLAGYEGEHGMPPSWECVPWKANGGYGNVAGNENKHRERLWFSPHCLRPGRDLGQLELLAAVDGQGVAHGSPEGSPARRRSVWHPQDRMRHRGPGGPSAEVGDDQLPRRCPLAPCAGLVRAPRPA